MLENACFIPVSDQQSDRRRASIQGEDRVAFKVDVTKVRS